VGQGASAAAGASTSHDNITSDIATLLNTRPLISQKLVDENDYPAWSVEATRQLWGNDLMEVVTGDEKVGQKISSNGRSARTKRLTT